MPRYLFGSLCLSLAFGLVSPLYADGHVQAHTAGPATNTPDGLEISSPWSRALPPTAHNGALFLTVKNQGQPDQLIAARSDIADTLELHTHVHENGLMKMRQVHEMDVPAGETLELKPGGHHIMLIGLRQPLREGMHFPVELEFAKGGKFQLDAEVLPLDAGTGAEHAHH